MNTDNLFHNQDEVMENIMLFSPMPVLQGIQDSFTESILADMREEDAEIINQCPCCVNNSGHYVQLNIEKEIKNKN